MGVAAVPKAQGAPSSRLCEHIIMVTTCRHGPFWATSHGTSLLHPHPSFLANLAWERAPSRVCAAALTSLQVPKGSRPGRSRWPRASTGRLRKAEVRLHSGKHALQSFSLVCLESAGDKGTNSRGEHLAAYRPGVKRRSFLGRFSPPGNLRPLSPWRANPNTNRRPSGGQASLLTDGAAALCALDPPRGSTSRGRLAQVALLFLFPGF